MDHLRIAVAGHVDHGKSTIVGRLLYEMGALSQRVTDGFDRARQTDAAAFAFVTDQVVRGAGRQFHSGHGAGSSAHRYEGIHAHRYAGPSGVP